MEDVIAQLSPIVFAAVSSVVHDDDDEAVVHVVFVCNSESIVRFRG